jgi:hypothetical protein
MPVIGVEEPREVTRYQDLQGKLKEALRSPEAVRRMNEWEADSVGLQLSETLRTHLEVLWALKCLPYVHRRCIELTLGPDDLGQDGAADRLGISPRTLRDCIRVGVESMIARIYS